MEDSIWVREFIGLCFLVWWDSGAKILEQPYVPGAIEL
jgi:hypothetical protein